jgi:hypothetical protein
VPFEILSGKFYKWDAHAWVRFTTLFKLLDL